jgi:hypothetical protein
MSLSTRSMGRAGPGAAELTDGDSLRLTSELIDLADDDLWRVLVIVSHASLCEMSSTTRGLAEPLVACHRGNVA